MDIIYPQQVELSQYLRIVKCSREYWREAAHTRYGGHRPRSHGLDLVIAGSGELWTTDDGPRRRFTAGDVILTRLGSWYCYDPLPGHSLEHIWIRADGEWIERAFASFGLSQVAATVIPARSGQDERFGRALKLCQAQSPHAITEAIGLVSSLFIEVLSDISAFGGRDAPAVDICERFCHYAVERTTEPRLDMEPFLQMEGVGYEAFRKRFKVATGDSPVRFWEAAKINHAKVLLASENRQVTDVANRLGFRDLYTFSAFFKRKTGTSPTAFRTHDRDT